jgi:hypothetical protein
MEIPPPTSRPLERDVRRAIIACGCARRDGVVRDGAGVGAVAGGKAAEQTGQSGGGGEGARCAHGARAARRGRPRSAGIRELTHRVAPTTPSS